MNKYFARPDQEEMEEAINNFLLLLEKQEKKGFKDLATILSQLPKPAQGSVHFMSVADEIEAGLLPALDKYHAHSVGASPVQTRSGSQVKLGYPGIA